MAIRGIFPGRTFPGRFRAEPAAEPPPGSDPAARQDARLGDVDWTAAPAGSVALRFPAPSGSLAAVSMGDPAGTPVILVPGAMGSKEDFALMLPILANAGYFAFSFDLAGQYESAAAGPEHLDPPRRRYDYDLFIEDLLAVLSA